MSIGCVSGVVAYVGLGAQIRIFPELEKTLAYARMIEAAGASLLAVHGRTRDQKDTRAHRADWAAIAAVRAALRIPVLANGDVRDLREAAACMDATGTVGVLSATPLLENPTLFSEAPAEGRPLAWPATLALEYVSLAEEYGAVPRMVRGHVHKLLGGWLSEFTDLRDMLNRGPHTLAASRAVCEAMHARLVALEAAEGRNREPVPAKGERQLAREAAEAAKAEAIAEAAREAAALEALAATDGCAAMGGCNAAEAPAEADAARNKRPRHDDDAAEPQPMQAAPAAATAVA